MPRQTERLNALEVARVVADATPGRWPDGQGLYLQISAEGAPSWAFRFRWGDKEPWMGLGRAGDRDVTLAQAREFAAAQRALLRQGINPIDHRDGERKKARLSAAASKTFKAVAVEVIKAKAPGWKNPKHAAQWESTLETYAYPEIGGLPVAAVDLQAVLRVLSPIWMTKPETASRVRQRIYAVIDAAEVLGYRPAGRNPADLAAIEKVLPPRREVLKRKPVRHHPAVPWAELPAFVSALRAKEGTGPKALLFAILTAARTAEVIGMRWGEVDLDAAEWVVPPDRMKATKEHRVPLSAPAREILLEMKAARLSMLPPADAEFVFPGHRAGKGLSNATLLMLMKRMGRAEVPHGFRSSLDTWASEETSYPAIVIDMALAHTIKDKTQKAYRRTDLLNKRRDLMADWAVYVMSKQAATVTPIGAATA